jgi:hypothetical protein
MLRLFLTTLLFLPIVLTQTLNRKDIRPVSIGEATKRGLSSDGRVDVTQFGVRALPPNITPAVPGTFGGCVTHDSKVVLSQLPSTPLLKGDGIALYGCGPIHSMKTPRAPEVTASIAAAPTGTGYVVDDHSEGSTEYCYVVVARNILGGRTAASDLGCISRGASSLGPQTVPVLKWTRIDNTVTATTAKPHSLPVGCIKGNCPMIFIQGTSDDAQFGAWFPLDSVPDKTHFIYSGGLDTRGTPVAASAAIGGSVHYFKCNHLKLPKPAPDVIQYIIYGRDHGHLIPLGVSSPAISLISDDPSYMVWDDFGPSMTTSPSLPYFVPNSPQRAPTPDNLITTVTSVSGNVITIREAPSTTVGRADLLFDNTPNILAAQKVAAKGGVLYFPVTEAYNYAYVTNSYLALNAVVSQAGPIWLGDTLQFSGTWRGELNDAALLCPQFCIQGHIPIFVAHANPGIFFGSGVLRNVAIQASGNGYNGLFLGPGNIPTAEFEDDTFSAQDSNSDYMGVLVTMFAQAAAGGAAGVSFKNVAMLSGPNQIDGSTATPLLISKNFGEIDMEAIMLNRRGLFFKPNQAGLTLNFEQRMEEQGGIMCMLSFYFAGGSAGGAVHIKDTILDTMSHPVACNFAANGTIAFPLSIDATNLPSAGMPLLSGRPFSQVTVSNTLVGRQLGQNVNLVVAFGNGCSIDGVFATNACLNLGKQSISGDIGIGSAYALHTESAALNPPLCNLEPEGSVGVGLHVYQYAPLWPNGGEGLPSSPCEVEALGGKQSVYLKWEPVAGAIGYNIYKDHFLLNAGGCSVPQLKKTIYTDHTGASCGTSQPSQSAGGPAGLSQGFNWALVHKLSPSANEPKSFPGVNLFELSADNWPAFNVNGSAKYFFAGTTGEWSPGQCAVATNVPHLFSLRPCDNKKPVVEVQEGVLESTDHEIGPVNLTMGEAERAFLFNWKLSLTAAGRGCSGDTSVVLNEIHTPKKGDSGVITPISKVLIAQGDGKTGYVASGVAVIVAEADSKVQFSAKSLADPSICQINPRYQVSWTLLQLN